MFFQYLKVLSLMMRFVIWSQRVVSTDELPDLTVDIKRVSFVIQSYYELSIAIVHFP